VKALGIESNAPKWLELAAISEGRVGRAEFALRRVVGDRNMGHLTTTSYQLSILILFTDQVIRTASPGVARIRLPELLVAEGSPQVPACHGAEGPPLFAKALNVLGTSVDVFDCSFESDIAKR
jgi:hypothetical protein